MTFDQFKKVIELSAKSEDADLIDNTIECAFIILSRACFDSEI